MTELIQYQLRVKATQQFFLTSDHSDLDFQGGKKGSKGLNSHCQQPGHEGTKAIKQEAINQTQEVVQERGNSENQRKLLILTGTV